MKTWSQEISAWQLKTFGQALPIRALDRAEDEWIELSNVLCGDQYNAHEAINEAADVVICLAAFVASLGGDLHEAIQAKMKVNENRQWHSNGDGTGYHIKETKL